MLIADKAALKAFCDRAESSPILCIDTEFLREKTFYAKLCLIQLATEDEIAIVDPLAFRDLSPLKQLFMNENIVKVFHAASQDLEIIYHDFGCLPTPVYDTQVAATLLGQSQQVGYGALVHSVCGVQLAKTESYTDWSKRPLSPSQVSYAEDDVRYLPKMYHIQVDQLTKSNRLQWLDGEFASMTDPARYDVDPRQLYLKLKRVGHLSRRQLSAAREITAWREEMARKHNIPRKWVLADEQIIEAAKREPVTIDSLFEVRGIREKVNTAEARELVARVKAGLALPEDQLPTVSKPSNNQANVDLQVDLMLALLRDRARANNIAIQTLASRDELEELARNMNDRCALMKGWKRTLVGEDLLRLLKGEISLSLNGDKLNVTAH